LGESVVCGCLTSETVNFFVNYNDVYLVVKINVTNIYGVITSPGYPRYMKRAHYEWTFRPTIPRARVAVYFEYLDLRRIDGGYFIVALSCIFHILYFFPFLYLLVLWYFFESLLFIYIFPFSFSFYWAQYTDKIICINIYTNTIALRASDVEFMFVRLYNSFLHFQQKKMAH
jgi:hypothetical protein